MAIKCRLQKLEKEMLGLHYYLTEGDYCYFIGEYTSERNYAYSEINQLIHNIKKDPSKRVTRPDEYQYKVRDIRLIGHCLANLIKPEYLNDNITVVPIPPSKTRNHPEYDDRILQICNMMAQNAQTPDVIELIQCTVDRDPTHTDEHKPPPQILQQTYRIVAPQNYQPRDYVFLVDDVLTTGSHFKACKNMIMETFQETEVIGIFIAHRIFPPVDI